jgi:hypothetical protein
MIRCVLDLGAHLTDRADTGTAFWLLARIL